MKARLRLYVAALLSPFALSLLFVGHAAAVADQYCKENSRIFLGFPTWYKYLNPTFVGGDCKLSFAFPEDIGKVLLAVIEILLRLGGLIAVGFVVYGGFKYIISQGEPEKTKTARQTIVNAMIGLVITIMATLIVAFIGNEFTK